MKIDNPVTEEQVVALINICKQCDVVYLGIQRLPQSLLDKGVQEQILFNDRTGSTRSIPISEFSVETVKIRMEEVMKLWQKKYRVHVTRTTGFEYELEAANEEEALAGWRKTKPIKEKEISWDYEIEIVD